MCSCHLERLFSCVQKRTSYLYVVLRGRLARVHVVLKGRLAFVDVSGSYAHPTL